MCMRHKELLEQATYERDTALSMPYRCFWCGELTVRGIVVHINHGAFSFCSIKCRDEWDVAQRSKSLRGRENEIPEEATNDTPA